MGLYPQSGPLAGCRWAHRPWHRTRGHRRGAGERWGFRSGFRETMANVSNSLVFYTTAFLKDDGFTTISIQCEDFLSVRFPLRTPCVFSGSFDHLTSVPNRWSLQIWFGVNNLFLHQVFLFHVLNVIIKKEKKTFFFLQNATNLVPESKRPSNTSR